MVFLRSDIGFFLSGGTSNTNPLLSIGGGKSNTSIVSGSKNALMPNISPPEALSGVTRYRCFYIQNLNATQSLQAAKLWILANTISSFDEIDIGLGSSGKNGTEQTLGSEFTIPSNITFLHPTSEVIAIDLGNLLTNDFYPIWVRCVVALNADFLDLNSGIIRCRGTPV